MTREYALPSEPEAPQTPRSVNPKPPRPKTLNPKPLYPHTLDPEPLNLEHSGTVCMRSRDPFLLQSGALSLFCHMSYCQYFDFYEEWTIKSGHRDPLSSNFKTLRVQVPNNHILTQHLYYNYYYPKPKYIIIGYMDPLGKENTVCSSYKAPS